MYKLFKGQLIVVWIAGIVLALFAFVMAIDGQGDGYMFLAVLIIAVLAFITVGWKNKRRCPKCKSMLVQRMEYGLPVNPGNDPNVYDAGCEQEDDSPEWHCADCGHEWGIAKP